MQQTDDNQDKDEGQTSEREELLDLYRQLAESRQQTIQILLKSNSEYSKLVDKLSSNNAPQPQKSSFDVTFQSLFVSFLISLTSTLLVSLVLTEILTLTGILLFFIVAYILTLVASSFGNESQAVDRANALLSEKRKNDEAEVETTEQQSDISLEDALNRLGVKNIPIEDLQDADGEINMNLLYQLLSTDRSEHPRANYDNLTDETDDNQMTGSS